MGRMQRVAARYLNNPHDADDVVQEVFLDLERNKERWEDARSKWAWAVGNFRIQLKRHLSKKHKHETRQKALDTEIIKTMATYPEVQKKLVIKENLKLAVKEIKKLNKETSMAFLLFTFQKKSIKEIAEMQ